LNFQTMHRCMGEWQSSHLDVLWGFVDATGNEVIPPMFDFVQSFSEVFAAVGIDDGSVVSWGFVYTAGNEVVPPIYDFAMSFSDGLAPVRLDGLWGFVDVTGTVVVPIDFPADNLKYLGEGLFRFSRDNMYGLAAIA